MPGSIADINIKLVANPEGLTKGLSAAEQRLSKFASSARSISSSATGSMGGIASALTGLGAGLSVAGLAAGLKGAISRLDELGDRATGLGESVSNLEKLDYVAVRMGSSGEAASKGMSKLTKVIGEASTKGGDAKKSLEGLGLNVQDLAQMNPAQAFIAVSQAIGDLPGTYDRASAAASIFGKSFGELMPLFTNTDGISEYVDDFDRLHGNVDKAAEIAGSAQDQFDRFNEAVKGFGEQSVIAFGPATTSLMRDAADALGDLNNATDGDWLTSFANGMKEAIESLKGPLSAFALGIRELNDAVEFTVGLMSKAMLFDSKFGTDALNKEKLQKHMDKSLSFRNRVEAIQNSGSPAGAVMDDALRRSVRDVYDYMNPKATSGSASAHDTTKQGAKTVAEQSALGQLTEDQMDELDKLGKSIEDDVMTPMEKYQKKMDELDEALRQGAITQETYTRAEQKYWDEATKAVEGHSKALDKATQKQQRQADLDRYASQMSWLDNLAGANLPPGGFVGDSMPANFRFFTDPATSAMQGGRSVYSAADLMAQADQAYADLQSSQGDPQLDEANQYLSQIAENTADMGMRA